MINSGRDLPPFSLQDGTAALLSERIDLLAWEADEQAIFLLVLGDVFDDVRDCLGDWHSLDCSFATQLLRHHPKTTMFILSFLSLNTWIIKSLISLQLCSNYRKLKLSDKGTPLEFSRENLFCKQRKSSALFIFHFSPLLLQIVGKDIHVSGVW